MTINPIQQTLPMMSITNPNFLYRFILMEKNCTTTMLDIIVRAKS